MLRPTDREDVPRCTGDPRSPSGWPAHQRDRDQAAGAPLCRMPQPAFPQGRRRRWLSSCTVSCARILGLTVPAPTQYGALACSKILHMNRPNAGGILIRGLLHADSAACWRRCMGQGGPVGGCARLGVQDGCGGALEGVTSPLVDGVLGAAGGGMYNGRGQGLLNASYDHVRALAR